MNEIIFMAKVTALHMTYDNQRNEYVTINFAYKPFKMPTMTSTDIPKDVSDMIKATKDMMTTMVPQQTHHRDYANRLVLFLTTDEFDRLEHKYTVGDELKIMVSPDGNITATRSRES